MVIGGQWHRDKEEDLSFVVPDSDDFTLNSLPKSRLARTTLHYVMKRPDDSRFVMDVLCIPRAAKTEGAQEVLEPTGHVLQDIRG